MPAYYTETLHDKTGSFIAQAAANITKLSEGSINDIRSLFPDSIDFTRFCAAWVDIDLLDVYDLRDQIYTAELQDLWRGEGSPYSPEPAPTK